LPLVDLLHQVRPDGACKIAIVEDAREYLFVLGLAVDHGISEGILEPVLVVVDRVHPRLLGQLFVGDQLLFDLLKGQLVGLREVGPEPPARPLSTPWSI
jgi:hypothetical protein